MQNRLNVLVAALALAAPVALITPSVAEAQSAAAKILEKARGQARDIEELRKVLNGPDQNMRLATFDAMIKSGDETLKQIALEAGLMSADSVMRAMAFKAVVMSLDNVHIDLAPDTSAPKPIVEASIAHLARNGTGLILSSKDRDIEAGAFKNGSLRGQVSGLEFTFDYGSYGTGTLTLADDNTMAGVVRVGRNTQFKATARLR